jgi:hypothetical protein
VRQLLTEKGLRQVDLAAGLTALGFDWTPNRVAQVVTGRRPLSLLETAGFCEALGISVAALLGPAGNAPLPAGNDVPVPDIASALRDGGGQWRARREADRAGAAKLKAHQAWVAEARQAYAEVHAKAARRLGITPDELEAASLRLWGRSLGLERDTRADASTGVAGDRALQERRRVATRQLLRELRDHLESTSGEAAR